MKQATKNLFIPVDCWLMMQSTRKPGCVCVSQNRAARAWGEQLRDKYVKPEKKAGRQRWQRWNIWPPVLIGQELQCNSTQLIANQCCHLRTRSIQCSTDHNTLFIKDDRLMKRLSQLTEPKNPKCLFLGTVHDYPKFQVASLGSAKKILLFVGIRP